MEKLEIMSVLDLIGVEFKRTLGKEKLLGVLAENVDFDQASMATVAKARGLVPASTYEGLLDQLGVVAKETEDGVKVGLDEPEQVTHAGDMVNVICMVDNVHLGDGTKMLFKERRDLPEDLALLLAEKEQVEIV